MISIIIELIIWLIFALLKKPVVVILLFIFSCQLFYSGGLTVWFLINQDAITKSKCINKDKPILKCNGNCYLARQLKEAENQQEENLPGQLKEWVSIAPCILPLNAYQVVPSAQTLVHMARMEKRYTNIPRFSIFHPPSVL